MPEGRHEALAEALIEAGASFRFCPACASPRLVSDRGRRWICPDCGFEYFHNVATAAGIVIDVAGRVLFLVRAREPALGKLALPGGFVEPGERAEDAALRECREELGWAPEKLEFLASYPNLYPYKGVPYATCDIYFRSSAPSLNLETLDIDQGESSSVRLAGLADLSWDLVAFESTRRALRRHLKIPPA
jgi:8-oxo-dGTP pyrophosphatase MutT (NUDIX family)